MCHDHDSEIVVEGIETRAQARFAAGLSCGLGQGYLWSLALSTADAQRLLPAKASMRGSDRVEQSRVGAFSA